MPHPRTGNRYRTFAATADGVGNTDGFKNGRNLRKKMVGVARIELATPAMSRQGHRTFSAEKRDFSRCEFANAARTKRESSAGLPHFYRTPPEPPMKPSEYLELAALCEKATGPDRELDVLIWAAMNGHEISWRNNDMMSGETLLGWIDPGEHSRNFSPLGSTETRPLFTASLDAALTLVPEGWIEGYTRQFPPYSCIAACSAPDGTTTYGRAATPALALCAAALRALAEGLNP